MFGGVMADVVLSFFRFVEVLVPVPKEKIETKIAFRGY